MKNIPRVAWYRQAYVKLAHSADGQTVSEVETRFLWTLAPTVTLASLNLQHSEPGHWHLLSAGFLPEGRPIRRDTEPDAIHGPAERAIHRRHVSRFLGMPHPNPIRIENTPAPATH